jgi:hypothetical protein
MAITNMAKGAIVFAGVDAGAKMFVGVLKKPVGSAEATHATDIKARSPIFRTAGQINTFVRRFNVVLLPFLCSASSKTAMYIECAVLVSPHRSGTSTSMNDVKGECKRAAKPMATCIRFTSRRQTHGFSARYEAWRGIIYIAVTASTFRLFSSKC